MRKKILLLAAAAMLRWAPLMAAQPLATDDTGTQGIGHIQVELGMERSRITTDNGGNTIRQTGWQPSATLTYGLTDRIDLITGLPWISQKIEAGGTTVSKEHGIGDLALQLKWRFVEMEDGRFSLAVRPGITLPSGDENRSFGNGMVSGGVRLIATHNGRLGAVHLNLGYTRDQYRLEAVRIASRNDIWHASIAGELNVADGLRAVADTGVETNRQKGDGTHPAYLLGGLIYSPSDRLDLDIGFRNGLNNAEQGSSLLAGITMHF
jgi:hypothetical protein